MKPNPTLISQTCRSEGPTSLGLRLGLGFRKLAWVRVAQNLPVMRHPCVKASVSIEIKMGGVLPSPAKN